MTRNGNDNNAAALYAVGFRLADAGDASAALEAYDEGLRLSEGLTEPESRRIAARTLVAKAVVLIELQRYPEAIELFDVVVTRFGEQDDPRLDEQVARALGNKGFVLAQHNAEEAAVTTYDELLARFENASDKEVIRQVCLAMLNKADALDRLGEHHKSLDTYDRLIHLLGESFDDSSRELLIRVEVLRGDKLHELNNLAEACTAYQRGMFLAGSEPKGPRVRRLAATAAFNVAVILDQQGETREAIEVYETLLASYATDDDASIQSIRSAASNRIHELTK